MRLRAAVSVDAVERSCHAYERRDVVKAIVLAAGAGTRFGGPKQVARVGGQTLLERSLLAARKSRVHSVLVVLGAYAEQVIERTDLHGATPVACSSWKDGLSASLRAGLSASYDADAVAVMLGDQPFVSADAINRVLAHRGSSPLAVRATYGGIPGHPVVIERALFGRLSQASGDVGARETLRSVDVRLVPCDDVASDMDVDTREDLDRVASSIQLRSARA